MVRLQNLCKTFWLKGSRKVVARNLNAEFPSGQCVAILGRNGAGKSSLMKIIAGVLNADSGQVLSDGTISWPVGFAGTFHADLTGVQNVRFTARVYGVDSAQLIHFAQSFAELGDHFYEPVRTYSSGMKARLAFGLSMGIPFDTYLMDEIGAVGDAAFKEKSAAVLKDRLRKSGAIMISHSLNQVKLLCDSGAVLENGNLTYYEDVDAAIRHHQRNMS